MMSTILRRSSSFSVKRTLSAACTSAGTNSYHQLPSASSTGSLIDGRNDVSSGETRSFFTINAPDSRFGIKGREFHAGSGPLSFRASLVSQAEFAVDDYASYDEEKGIKGNSTSGGDGLEVAKLGISEEIVTALKSRGIEKLFPIQKAVLEPAMQGRDMIGRARTGTGKTLAFGIPIIDKIIKFNAKHGKGRNPLCLVLAPTRELARQVEKEFHESAPSLDTICVYGGTPIGQQMRQLDYGVDIAVGTPGRVIDLIKRGALNLSEVQFVVLDEADQMLQVGFAEDVEIILQKLPQNRQSMMFSATMPNWIKSLTLKYLKNPLTVDLVGDSDQKLADGITLYSIASDSYAKGSIIGPLITEHAKGGKCIVFTQTKRDADRLAYAMARSFKCEALHGDISQSQRERTLAGFRAGHFNVLVATDVAARGLDVPSVDLVIHYELPNNTETFVHRTGRTGRAGKKGSAILIYSREQARTVKQIEREVGSRFNELPSIAVEGGDSMDMFSDMRGPSRSGSFGGGMRDRRSGDMGFGRSGGQGGGSGFGRFGGGGGGSRSQGFGRSGDSGMGGFGSNSNRSGGFGDFGSNSNRSGGSFGDFGSKPNRSGGGFGSFGDFGSSRSGSQSGSSGGFGNSSRPSRFGSFDD